MHFPPAPPSPVVRVRPACVRAPFLAVRDGGRGPLRPERRPADSRSGSMRFRSARRCTACHLSDGPARRHLAGAAGCRHAGLGGRLPLRALACCATRGRSSDCRRRVSRGPRPVARAGAVVHGVHAARAADVLVRARAAAAAGCARNCPDGNSAPRRGSQHIVQLWHAPDAEKMLIVPGAEFYAQNQAVELSNWCGCAPTAVGANPRAVAPHARRTRPRLHTALRSDSPSRCLVAQGVPDVHVLRHGARGGRLPAAGRHGDLLPPRQLRRCGAGCGRVTLLPLRLRLVRAARPARVPARGSHACTAPRLTLCEVSTPFLNLRWVFKCVSYADVARCAALTPAP